ncbi:MAG: pyridoxal-phosphate dependent enzyme [Woeseiaceae bacterium]|nr:pyridoxal-phosphate dependent enzyme [Woeseiaceae bacterium]
MSSDLDAAFGRMPLAELPTPVSVASLDSLPNACEIAIKRDDLTGLRYGGNKIRKLEYLLYRARQRGARRVATFGAIGSNHAVATALCSINAGFECTCLLAHQSLKPGLGRALKIHQSVGTEIVALSGDRRKRVATMRRALQGRNVFAIPMGGSSWLGTVGFVNAGLELAAQIEAGECALPARVYVAFGTMGTAVGIALGLALAGLETETHAVRVTETSYASETAARRLMAKTAMLMRRLDPAIPADLAARASLVCRHEFFGEGYGVSNPETDRAIDVAREELGLGIESTYTGKAMRALLTDLRSGYDRPVLFWNTYNSRPIEIDDELEPDFSVIPEEFRRYF